jgi:hypothetical protein
MNYYKTKLKRKCDNIALDRNLGAIGVINNITGVGI